MSNLITEFVAYAFVDDTDLVTSAKHILENATVTMQGLQEFATNWDDALYITGGAIVPEKSHWTMISLTWKNDKWIYQSKEDLPGDIMLKDPMSRIPKPIKRLKPHKAEETLGVYLAGDGNNKQQIGKLLKKSQVFAQCVKTGRISKYDMNAALRTTVLKTLQYPILATNINENNWNRIMSPAVRSAIPQMGYIRTLPKEIVYGPSCLGGLEIRNLWHLQHIQQIQYVLEEVNHDSIVKNLIITSAEQFTIEASTNADLCDYLMDRILTYTTNCWWKSLMSYCYRVGFILYTNIKLPTPVCDNDLFIMKEVIKFSWTRKELRIINECQMALKAILISDIVLADGKTIASWAWSGSGPTCKSMLTWPKPATLTRRHWNLWKKALGVALLCTDISRQTLRNPLGCRNCIRQQQISRRFWAYSREQNQLFLFQDKGWILCLPSATQQRRNTRRKSFTRSDNMLITVSDPIKFASVEGSFDDKIVTLTCLESFVPNHLPQSPPEQNFQDHLRR